MQFAYRTCYCVFGLVLVASMGCGKATESDAESVGQAVGENVTQFAKGVGRGIDNQMQIEVELSPELTESGITSSIAKLREPQSSTTARVTVYFIAERQFKARLAAKAFNEADQEIGRASTEVSFAADDAQYVEFVFPAEMDSQLVAVYRIGTSAQTPPETSAAEAPDADSANQPQNKPVD